MIMDSLCVSSPAGNETFEMFFEGIFRESPFSGFGMIQFTNESQNVFVDLGLRPPVADGVFHEGLCVSEEVAVLFVRQNCSVALAYYHASQRAGMNAGISVWHFVDSEAIVGSLIVGGPRDLPRVSVDLDIQIQEV